MNSGRGRIVQGGSSEEHAKGDGEGDFRVGVVDDRDPILSR